MNCTILPAVIGLAAALSAAPSIAAPDAKPMAGMKAMAPAAQRGTGTGVVTAVDAKAGTLTIRHGAIAALKWPAMTMTFHAKPPSLLKAAKVGEKISFDVNMTSGAPEVTAIRKP